MEKKLIVIFLCLGFFFFSFTNKKDNIIESNDSFVKSLVQSTDYLKLHINSPMTLTEYTANRTDRAGLIKSSSKNVIFIPNKGQIIDTEGNLRPDILYKAELNGVNLYLTNKGMSFVFFKYEDAPKNLAAGDRKIYEYSQPFDDKHMKDKIVKMYRMDLDIVGMNTNVRTLNEEQTTEYFNFYYAHCPDGVTNVYGYRKVIFKDVYENIDLVYHNNEIGLKYDFIVKPGGNVSDIKLKYRNEKEVYITSEGKIKAINPFGEIKTDVLYTYQSDGKVVESNYIKDTDGEIRIITEEYDRSRDLIIDPYIGATYYGGSSWDFGESIITDVNDNILITGYTGSTNFPVQNPGGGAYFQNSNTGYDDVFILKFNSSGVRLWATYYGGDEEDIGFSIATKTNNDILVTGRTRSTNFPVQNPGGGTYYQSTNSWGFDDVFILKFNSSGVRQWATYYGGDWTEWGNSINIDNNNNILITGWTNSSNFPLQNPGGGAYYQNVVGDFDAFILKFNSNGIRQWATYYGGNDIESGNSITTDGNSNIIITGHTRSTDLPLQNPGGGAYFQSTHGGGFTYLDAFVLKFNSSGVRQWATYYGGNGRDYGNSITSDGNNNILITGDTKSTNFPLQNPGGGAYFQSIHTGGDKVFIIKFNANCIRYWATYYGGNSYDNGYSITTDGNNNILITGTTSSTDFPVHDPGGSSYYQNTLGGVFNNAFILKFAPSGFRQWATYYGGNGPDDGNCITVNGINSILITGETYGSNFPLFNPGGNAYYQNTYGGGYRDAFILGFTPSGVIGVNVISTNVPHDYALYQNYPNPFNPTTSIKFDIPKTSNVKIIIYDIIGKEVITLVNEKLNAGSYEVNWNASNYTSGVYFYKLIAEEYIAVKKMLLIK